MRYRHVVSAMALVAGGGLIWAAGGCALVVGADFGDRKVREESDVGKPCYSGPAGTENVGPCLAGRIDESGACAGEVTPQPEICVSAEDESCDGFDDCNGALIELLSFGNAERQNEPRVVVDAAGFIYLALESNDPVDYGGGPIGTEGIRDVHLVKLDPQLQHVWSINIGGGEIGSTEEHNLRALALDPDGNVVIGVYFRGSVRIEGQELPGTGDDSMDLFIAKISGDKEVAWAQTWKGAGDAEPRSIATGADGSIVVTGGFNNTIELPGVGFPLTGFGDRDVFVVKLHGDGKVRWAKVFGDGSYQEAFGVSLGAGGEVALTGRFRTALGFDAAMPITTASPTENGFLAVLEPDGRLRWTRGFLSPTGLVAPIDVAVDPGGRVLVTGHFDVGDADFGLGALVHAGGQDAFLGAYALENGTPLWALPYGDAAGQVGFRLDVDPAGQVLWAGTADGTIRFGDQDHVTVGGSDAFVVKFAPITATGPGAVIWAKLIGQEGFQSTLDVAHGPFGGVVPVGYTDTDFKIGTTSAAHVGGGDVWIAAFLP